MPGFFEPNPLAFWGPRTALGADRAGYYSTAPLEKTLLELVNFPLVNRCKPRLTVVIIVIGVAWSTFLFLNPAPAGHHYDDYKVRIGRSLLLGLEMLVAADIVKTIAIEATLMSLGVLAGLVLVRTFLSWTLVLEIEGRWPGTIAAPPLGIAGTAS